MVPPSDDAQGVVLNVDANTGLATITIPGDLLRVGAGSRFEAYRLKPNPKYLGKIEILEVQDSIAVGRLLDARFGSLEKGDLVASKVADKQGGGAVRAESDSAWAERFFEKKSWDFGTVRRGEQLFVNNVFRLINRLDKPIHIAGVRASAAYLTPRLVVAVEGGAQESVAEAWLGPHQSATIEVSIDARRFVGDKTASIYVQFDQPSPADVRLQVRGRSVESPAGTTVKGEPEESKARILELEMKVDQLMKQIDALHDQLKQQPARPRTGSSRIEAVPGMQTQRYIREAEGTNPAKP